MRVAAGADHFEDLHAVVVVEFQHGNVERSTTQVEHDDLLFFLCLVQTVGHRGRRRLVDDPGDFQAGDLTGVLGCLTLGVVEVGRDRDHGLVDLVTEIGLGCFLQLSRSVLAEISCGVYSWSPISILTYSSAPPMTL